MSRILLIETATEVCSVAIAVDGEVVAMEEELQSLQHAALLTLQIEACVKTSGIPLASLDAVAVSRGPGSYTSLRVGASVAKGICYALDKPLIAIDTLLSLAWASREEMIPSTLHPLPSTVYRLPSTVYRPPSTVHPLPSTVHRLPSTVFIPMLDARRQEVWLAVFDERLEELAPEQPLIAENDLFDNLIRQVVPRPEEALLVISGNGSWKLENGTARENAVFSPVKKCSAQHMKTLAEHFFQNADFQNVAYFEPFYMKAPNITAPSKGPF